MGNQPILKNQPISIEVCWRTTELKASEAEQVKKTLQGFEDVPRLFIDHIACNIALFNLDGTIIFSNFLGLPSEGVDDSIFSYTSTECGELLRRTMDNILRTGKPETLEIPLFIPHRESTTWWSICLERVIQDGNVIGFATVCTDITKLKRVEYALRESEAKLKDAQTLGRIGSWEFDIESQEIKWSDQTYKLYDRDPALGPPTVEEEAAYYSQEQALKLREYARYAIEEGKASKYDLEAELPDGRHVFYSATMQPIKDDYGRVVKLFGTIQDITERKQDERLLSESEEKLRRILEASPDAITVTDLNANIIECNQAALKLHGFSTKEELIGMNAFDLIAPRDRQRAARNMKKVLTEDFVKDMEYNLLTKNGRECIGQLFASVIRDTSNNPTSFVAITKDITKRKQAELRLQETEERYKSLFESSIELIYIHDFQGNFIDANVTALETIGYTKEEISSVNFKTLLSEDQLPKAMEVVKEIREKGSRSGFTEYKIKRKDGKEVYIETKGSIVYKKGKPYAIQGLARDITEHKRIEEMERLATMGRIAASIAHEINNPLAGIKNSFLLIKDAIPEDYPYYKYVSLIEKEINRVAYIVRQMLDFYRSDQDIPYEFLVDKVIQDVVTMLKIKTHENNQIIKVDTSSAAVAVILPKSMLQQVLYNVIQNAIEASPHDGIVEVTAAADKNVLTVNVSDQGSGIPEEIRSLIFMQFFTTKGNSVEGGLGLGLSVSKSMVEAMGGAIDFENKPDKGTVFHIILPFNRPIKEVQGG